MVQKLLPQKHVSHYLVGEFVMKVSFIKAPNAKGGTHKNKISYPYFPNNSIQTVSNNEPFRDGAVTLQQKEWSPHI